MKRFSKMASHWWLENGEYEPLHRMNTLRVPLVRDTLSRNRSEYVNTEEYSKESLLREPLLGLNLLDVGCGGGILSEVIECESSLIKQLIILI